MGKKTFRSELFMILPVLFILGAITLYPFVYLIIMSFMNFRSLMGLSNIFCGFSNWAEMISDSTLINSWIVTIKYVGISLLLEVAIGTIISIILYLIPYNKFKTIIVVLVMFPMFISSVIVGLSWRFLFSGTYGLFAHILMALGISNANNILGNVSTALPGIITMDVWEWTPLVIIIIYAMLLAVPQEITEAALVDGANYFQIILYIFTPYLRRGIVMALLIRGMDLIRDSLPVILVTTQGGPANSTKTLSMKVYENAFRFFNFGYASVLAITLLILSIILANIFLLFLREKKEHNSF